MSKMRKIVERFDREEGSAGDFIRLIYGEPLHWGTAIAAGWLYLKYGGQRLTFDSFRNIALDELKQNGISPSDTLWKWVERMEAEQYMD